MESRPASELPVAQVAALFNKSFEGYIWSAVPANFSEESFSEAIRLNFISLPRSHVFYAADKPSEPVGLAIIAVRPDKPTETRLLAMGIFKSARGKSAGTAAVRIILDAEKACGMERVGWECVKQNTAAVKLYRRAGSTTIRELFGWQREPTAEGEFKTSPDLKSCTFEEIDLLVKTHSAKNLPWQAWGFAKKPEENRAFRLGDAYCVVTDPEDKEKDAIRLECLIVDPRSRGKGEARRLVEAMLGRYPGKKWVVLPRFPREYGESIAAHFGFKAMEVSQYQMEYTFV
ncbi:hypothetical protein FQN49_006808 [Arthroderma sp. PD_2]|nr:hypothetical protein FQN49_006808 [Arthroderma sp. PD_2]